VKIRVHLVQSQAESLKNVNILNFDIEELRRKLSEAENTISVKSNELEKVRVDIIKSQEISINSVNIPKLDLDEIKRNLVKAEQIIANNYIELETVFNRSKAESIVNELMHESIEALSIQNESLFESNSILQSEISMLKSIFQSLVTENITNELMQESMTVLNNQNESFVRLHSDYSRNDSGDKNKVLKKSFYVIKWLLVLFASLLSIEVINQGHFMFYKEVMMPELVKIDWPWDFKENGNGINTGTEEEVAHPNPKVIDATRETDSDEFVDNFLVYTKNYGFIVNDNYPIDNSTNPIEDNFDSSVYIRDVDFLEYDYKFTNDIKCFKDQNDEVVSSQSTNYFNYSQDDQIYDLYENVSISKAIDLGDSLNDFILDREFMQQDYLYDNSSMNFPCIGNSMSVGHSYPANLQLLMSDNFIVKDCWQDVVNAQKQSNYYYYYYMIKIFNFLINIYHLF
jgi:hypothetical protein